MDHFDLADLDTRKGAEQGFELELTHPKNDTPLGMFITIIGEDAPDYKAQLNDHQRSRTQKFLRKRNWSITPEEAEAEGIDLLVAATRGFRNVVLNGGALAFNANAARKLYTEYPWVREQVAAAVQDRANFLPKAASSS